MIDNINQTLTQFKVSVRQLVENSRLSFDDKQRNPTGTYNFYAENEEQALDEFHSVVPISFPEHYDISVTINEGE